MLRGAQKASQKKQQQSKSTTKSQQKKQHSTVKKSTTRKLHTKKQKTAQTSPSSSLFSLSPNRTKHLLLSNQMSSFSTEQTASATESTSGQTTQQPATTKTSHESGFDLAIGKLKNILHSDEKQTSEILNEQHSNISNFKHREWQVKDTLTILPHFLELLQPTSPFVSVASHRVANLRAQLKQGELERYRKAKELATDKDKFAEDETARASHLTETTIDLIPVSDLLRLQMQILFTTTQFVHLSYQNYCKESFNFDQNGALLFTTILEHLETVPQLTFYRMHYQQSLLNLSSTLIKKPHVQMLDIMSSITPETVQNVFLKRLAFSTSQGFKDALKDSFTRNNVLADTTMLPLSDPTNIMKSELISAISVQGFSGISRQAGIRGDSIGHFLFETEMAMGVRFPREPKHILNVKTQYNSSNIAKMPQNPQILNSYAEITSEIQISEKKEKELILKSQQNKDEQIDDLLQQERMGSIQFIANVEELPVHFPEDLWSVPVSREARASFFKKYPQAHAVWSVYNQLINTATQLDNDMANIEKLEQHNDILTKSQIETLSSSEKDQIEAKIELNTHRITLLKDKIEPNRQMLEVLTEEYEIKAEPWRIILNEISQKSTPATAPAATDAEKTTTIAADQQ